MVLAWLEASDDDELHAVLLHDAHRNGRVLRLKGAVDIAQAEVNLSRSRGELEKARGQLATAVGLPVNQTLNLQTLSEPLPKIVTSSPRRAWARPVPKPEFATSGRYRDDIPAATATR